MAHAARAVARQAEAEGAEAAAGCQNTHSVRVAASVRRLTALEQHCGAHAAVDAHAAVEMVRQGALQDAMHSAGLLYVPPGALSAMLRDSEALFGGAGSGAHTLLQLCDSVPQPFAAELANAWLSSQAAPRPVSAPPRAKKRRKGKAAKQAAGTLQSAQPVPVAQAAVPQQPGQAVLAAAPEAAGELVQAAASEAAGGQQPALAAEVAPQHGEKGDGPHRSQAPATAAAQDAEASFGERAGTSEPAAAAVLPDADGAAQQLPVREQRGAEEALAKRWEKKRKGGARRDPSHAAAADLAASHAPAGGRAAKVRAATSPPSGAIAAELLAADALAGTDWAPAAKIAAPAGSAAADVAQILLERGLADQDLEQALPGQGLGPGCEAGAEAHAQQQPLSVTDHRAQRRLMRKQAKALLGSLMGSGGSISVLARAKAELEAQAAKVCRRGAVCVCARKCLFCRVGCGRAGPLLMCRCSVLHGCAAYGLHHNCVSSKPQCMRCSGRGVRSCIVL